MSLSIKINDASFSHYFTEPVNPVPNGLVAEYLYGVSEADSVRNRVTGSIDAAAVGDISYSQSAAIFESGSAGFDLQRAMPDEVTLLCVGRATTETAGALWIHNFGELSTGPNYTGILQNSSGTPVHFRARYQGGQETLNFTTTAGSYRILSLSIRNLGVDSFDMEARQFFGGSAYTQATSVAQVREANPDEGLRVGHSTANITGAILNIAASAVWDRGLSTQELADVEQYFAAVLAGRGIIV